MDIDNNRDKREIIIELLTHRDYKPMKIKEIASLLQISGDDRMLLEDVLDSLVKEGKVIRTKKGKYVLPEEIDYIIGKFISHQKGFGFIEIEGEEEDVFIPSKYTNGAFHGDKVAIQLIKDAANGKRKEGTIVEVLERGKNEIIGTFQKSTSFGFVIPDNKKFSKDIFISKSNDMGAVTGHKVVVKLTNWGDEDKKPEGEIVEILGHINDPETDILAIVRGFEIPSKFPNVVMSEVESVSNIVKENEKEGRLDLRDKKTVTIDGEDAKDLDDAITIERKDDYFTLGVHIADVTNYVTEDSALDKEAIKRGTSVYLVDRVIPMLPHKLSNGICSLNQGEDRLALSCIMDVDFNGNILSQLITETLINVDRRMTYTNVKKILDDNDKEVINEYLDFVNMFEDMKELAQILRGKRKKRGSIDFDFPEAKVILNEKGEPIEIKPYDRNVATKIIEEFMLLANETVAEYFFWQETPFVYRSHEEPDPDKINSLGQFIYNFGYHIKGKGEIHPKEIQKLLIDIEGKKEEGIISRLALRSMRQAKYTTTNDGHYGLATKYYCHFTSPIRRYPDLQIHRIIKDSVNGRLNESKLKKYEKLLPEIAKKSSEYERRAEEAERETIKLKKVEYMSKFIGEQYEGVISGVTTWGLYVELPNTVEGLIHVTALEDDYYIHDEKKHCFIGERTGKVYSIGDTIKVEVKDTDKMQRTIDFDIVN